MNYQVFINGMFEFKKRIEAQSRLEAEEKAKKELINNSKKELALYLIEIESNETQD